MELDRRFIVSLKGREYVQWGGLLDLAHQAGLKSLATEIVQIPSAENGWTAVVMATARFEDGREFVDVGDCSPANASPQIATAALRMANTRAKGRALRDAVNIGQTMLEELPDLAAAPEATPPDPPRATRTAARPHPAPERPAIKPEGKADAAPICRTEGCHKPLTRGQYEVSLRAYGQPLCPGCQKSAAKVAA